MREASRLKYEKINKLIEKGMGKGEAIKKVGASPVSYKSWKQEMENSKALVPYLHEVPHIEPQRASRVVCIVGSPEDVAAILGAMK